LAVGAHSP
jgi:hypothetical protein